MLIDIIAGARPNFMKIAPIIKALEAREARAELPRQTHVGLLFLLGEQPSKGLGADRRRASHGVMSTLAAHSGTSSASMADPRLPF